MALCYLSVDRPMRSVEPTLDLLAPPALADLCPRLARVDASGAVPALGLTVDDRDRPTPGTGERPVWRGTALVRVHTAVGDDEQPLLHGHAARARLVAVAAGTGPLAVTPDRLLGVLRPTPQRPRLAYAMGWAEVDDVGPAPSGGVRLLSTLLLGGLTIDVLRHDLFD